MKETQKSFKPIRPIEKGSKGFHLKQIAQMKMPDLNANSIEQAMREIEGTARSSGIEIAD